MTQPTAAMFCPTNSQAEPAAPPIRLRLPATSANLGPGFDALGLALSLYLTIDACRAGEFCIEATGRDAHLCSSIANNLILMTYSEILGQQGLAAPPIRLRVHNEIPFGMGCGSSAAALLAGVFLANHFGDLQWTSKQLLDEACTREGHPDNVAACFHGGLTASSTVQAASIEPEAETITATLGHDLRWKLFVALPGEGLPTRNARALLPDSYRCGEAVANVQATALLVSAFALDRPDLLRFAMRDHLHQPFRSVVCPLLPALLPLAGQHGVCGVALSGAGPSVLIIAENTADSQVIREAVRSAGGRWLVEILEASISVGSAVERSI